MTWRARRAPVPSAPFVGSLLRGYEERRRGEEEGRGRFGLTRSLDPENVAKSAS